ncbi:MAG: branched-chain amino acid transport system substrate-binding protein [Hyphomicrobiales bacterium]|jgi:branched-chain amino acid transport system substrate-binding protein|nr:branched-chain amino acid transport system substrate-binding protein [Hyphomicrobiales bacterium]
MKLRAFALSVLGLLACSVPVRAQISDDLVKIGVLDDMSGLYADVSGVGGVVAARLAVEDFGGSVLGKKIEIVSGDHQNKPDIGALIARSWYDVEKVDIVIGLGNSAVALAVQALARERNKLNIVTGAGATDLTGKACSPNAVQWTWDTYALAKGTATAIARTSNESWFFLTADNNFGHSLEEHASSVVKSFGRQIVGAVRHPLGAPDFSSFLLQAQSKKAGIVALANGGGDTVNSIKQASEFGITKTMKLAGMLVMITDVHAIGLKLAQGLLFTEAFYWDQNEETRAWSKRFMARHKNAPTMVQAGVYGAVTHYLKAVQATGTDAPQAVMARMRETPVNDFMTKNGKIRPDGRLVRDMYLMQAKSPSESKGPWDYMKVVATIAGNEAFRPLSEGGCPLVTQ